MKRVTCRNAERLAKIGEMTDPARLPVGQQVRAVLPVRDHAEPLLLAFGQASRRHPLADFGARDAYISLLDGPRQ